MYAVASFLSSTDTLSPEPQGEWASVLCDTASCKEPAPLPFLSIAHHWYTAHPEPHVRLKRRSSNPTPQYPP